MHISHMIKLQINLQLCTYKLRNDINIADATILYVIQKVWIVPLDSLLVIFLQILFTK